MFGVAICDSDRIRTCDLRIRSQLLYPAELRNQLGCKNTLILQFTKYFFENNKGNLINLRQPTLKILR